METNKSEDKSIVNQIENIKRSRAFLLNLVKDLNVDQLNYIPTQFQNNIIWNMGHLIWAQQDCYTISGLNTPLDKEYIALYKTGTFPREILNENKISEIKRLLIEPLEVMNRDLPYNHSETAKAIQGLPLHDWLHIGYILALKHMV